MSTPKQCAKQDDDASMGASSSAVEYRDNATASHESSEGCIDQLRIVVSKPSMGATKGVTERAIVGNLDCLDRKDATDVIDESEDEQDVLSKKSRVTTEDCDDLDEEIAVSACLFSFLSYLLLSFLTSTRIFFFL